jgi:hypothetical protein
VFEGYYAYAVPAADWTEAIARFVDNPSALPPDVPAGRLGYYSPYSAAEKTKEGKSTYVALSSSNIDEAIRIEKEIFKIKSALRSQDLLEDEDVKLLEAELPKLEERDTKALESVDEEPDKMRDAHVKRISGKLDAIAFEYARRSGFTVLLESMPSGYVDDRSKSEIPELVAEVFDGVQTLPAAATTTPQKIGFAPLRSLADTLAGGEDGETFEQRRSRAEGRLRRAMHRYGREQKYLYIFDLKNQAHTEVWFSAPELDISREITEVFKQLATDDH